MSAISQRYRMFVIAWILCDSLFTYFLRNQLGFEVAVNIPLLAFLAFALVHYGMAATMPDPKTVLLVVCSVATFSAGLYDRSSGDLATLGAPILGATAFFLGYLAFRSDDDVDAWGRVFLLVGGAYCLVCAAALLEVAPTIFPVREKLWAGDDGTLVDRPAVTTNQNFQFMYLMPALLVLAMPFKAGRFLLGVLFAAVSAFVLLRLQTRSGVIVMACIVGLAALAPLFTRAMNRRQALVLPAVVTLLALALAPRLHDVAEPLVARFAVSDQGGGRVPSVMYLLEAMQHLEWWFVPHGESDFAFTYGDVPHSQITSVFLHGGIVGLVMWICIVPVPLLALAGLWLRRRLDALATVVFVAGAAMLILQLTLNLTYFKQPWVWAGAVLGTLRRVRAGLEVPRHRLASRSYVLATTYDRPGRLL